jgi:putative nucleotidyltransferase with HDIG domain
MFEWLSQLWGWLSGPSAAPRLPSQRTASLPGNSAAHPAGPKESGPTAPLSEDRPNLLDFAEYPLSFRENIEPELEQQHRLLTFQIQEHFRQHPTEVPPLPKATKRILQLISDPDVNILELISLIKQDQGMVTQVLKIANSAWFSRGHKIENIRDAVTRLGIKTIAQIATATSLESVFMSKIQSQQVDLLKIWQRLWLHSMTVALSASWLAMEIRRGNSEYAFMGGILHDVGKTAALRSLSAILLDRRPAIAISERLGAMAIETCHWELGNSLTDHWDLPEYLQRIIKEHHRVGLPADPGYDELHLIRVVSGLNEIRSNPWHGEFVPHEVMQSVDVLGLPFRQLRVIVNTIKDFAQKAGSMFPNKR